MMFKMIHLELDIPLRRLIMTPPHHKQKTPQFPHQLKINKEIGTKNYK
jgi:hypothetical protein